MLRIRSHNRRIKKYSLDFIVDDAYNNIAHTKKKLY